MNLRHFRWQRNALPLGYTRNSNDTLVGPDPYFSLAAYRVCFNSAFPLASSVSTMVSIEESNLAAVGDMTPVVSVTVSEPALTYMVEVTGIEPMTYCLQSNRSPN